MALHPRGTRSRASAWRSDVGPSEGAWLVWVNASDPETVNAAGGPGRRGFKPLVLVDLWLEGLPGSVYPEVRREIFGGIDIPLRPRPLASPVGGGGWGARSHDKSVPLGHAHPVLPALTGGMVGNGGYALRVDAQRSGCGMRAVSTTIPHLILPHRTYHACDPGPELVPSAGG